MNFFFLMLLLSVSVFSCTDDNVEIQEAEDLEYLNELSYVSIEEYNNNSSAVAESRGFRGLTSIPNRSPHLVIVCYAPGTPYEDCIGIYGTDDCSRINCEDNDGDDNDCKCYPQFRVKPNNFKQPHISWSLNGPGTAFK